MRYMFLIYLDERAREARSEAEIKAAMALHTPYIELLRRNGQYAGSEALEPARAARTLRSSGGKPLVTEGPFAESPEQLGGYCVVLARDMDEAVNLASQCPDVRQHAIEVRPIRSTGA